MNEGIFKDLIGKPFKLNGRGPDFYDCYGLYLEINRRIGNSDIPDVKEVAESKFEEITKRVKSNIHNWIKIDDSNKHVGDAVLFIESNDYYGHIGVVITKYHFMQVTETRPVHVVGFSHPWFRNVKKEFYRYDYQT